MLTTIRGTIIHFGTNDLGNGKYSLTVDRATGDVASIDSLGNFSTRTKGSSGPNESFQITGNGAVVWPGVTVGDPRPYLAYTLLWADKL